MDKEMNMENIENLDTETPVAETEEVAADVAEEPVEEKVEEKPLSFLDVPPPSEPRKPYQPRFTDASERYRMRGDARIRERLGIKAPAMPNENPDEIKFDATAEFDEDFVGTLEAKSPENVAVDEADETLNVFKFTEEEREAIDLAAEREREEIRKLLRSEPTPAPVEEKVEVEEPDEAEEPVVEEEKLVEETVEAEHTPDLPDPDDASYGDFGVYEFESEEEDDEPVDEPSGIDDNPREAKKTHLEFNNPAERDSIKDIFLDSIISIRIRAVASFVFALALLVL